MDIIEVVKRRYSTKVFDSKKKIPEELIEQIEGLLQLSASSLNLQPWHFILVTSKNGKKKLAKSTEGNFILNKDKILDASVIVVFSARKEIEEEYLLHVLEKEEEDGRFELIDVFNNENRDFKDSSTVKTELKEDLHNFRNIVINSMSKEILQNWISRQIYLNVGAFLLGVAALGLDALPIEGFDANIADEELGLGKKGFTSLLLVPIGYHTEDDFNAQLPKSRLLKEEVIERL